MKLGVADARAVSLCPLAVPLAAVVCQLGKEVPVVLAGLRLMILQNMPL